MKIVQIQAQQALFREQYQFAVSDDQNHVMLKADSLRLYTIKNNITDTGNISDKDLDSVIAIAQTGSRGSTWPGLVTANVASTLLHLKSITPDQKLKLFSFAASLITTNNPADTAHLDQIFGSKLIEMLQDKRGVPLLLPLLQNTSPYVRKNAVKALYALGYTVNSSTL